MNEDVQNKILELVNQANPQNPMAFVRNIIKDSAIGKMNNYIASCNDCGMCNLTRTIAVGNPRSSVMIISDCATSEQLQLNQAIAPFEGTQEISYLKEVFNYLNVNLNEIFWMNCVNCCPSKIVDKHEIYRCPTTKEIEKCSAFVKYAVDVVQPAMVILLGNIALNCFQKASITKVHGQWTTAYTIPAMPVYSPTHIKDLKGRIPEDQRNIMKNDMLLDLKAAFLYLQRTYPNNNVLTAPIM